MSRAYDLFRPNRLKLLLAGTLLVPGFFLLVLVNGFLHNDLIFPSVITMVICYVAASVIDDAIKSRTVKIVIATVAALVSIILGSILVRSMTMVCDPVHTPRPATDAPSVIATVQPAKTTPMIFEPVHKPDSCSGDICEFAPGITTGIVAQQLDECFKIAGDASDQKRTGSRADAGTGEK